MGKNLAYVLLAVSSVVGFVTLVLQFMDQPQTSRRVGRRAVLAIVGCGMAIGAAVLLLL